MKFNASRVGGASSPHFIKLKGGDQITGILRGDPLEYEEAFKGQGEPRFQFQVNMVVLENGVLVAKILRGGWKIYSQLQELQKAGWELDKVYLKISRVGNGQQDTVYSATPSPTPVPADTLAKVAQVSLHVLTGPSQAQATQNGLGGLPAQAEEDVPF